MRKGQLIDCEELYERRDDEKIGVIDCRFDLANPLAGRSAYQKGRILSAAYSDLNQDLSSVPSSQDGRHPLPDVTALVQHFRGLGLNCDTEVVVYDAGNGSFAARCWWLLSWLGHSNTRLLNGGLAAWTARGYPLVDGEAKGAAKGGCGNFTGSPRMEWLLGTEEISSPSCDVAELFLFDARDSKRFCGEYEPIDPVAGHIPGARSLPLSESLNLDGTFKSDAELRALWLAVLDGNPKREWSVMCGSGVTACHLALSGVQAGMRHPRLYAGSWSEWIRDPERQVAKGGD